MTAIAGRSPAPLPAHLLTSCLTVKSEIAAVVETLRSGSAPTGASLVAVQDTATRVRNLVGQPGVAPFLYTCIEDVVMEDIRNNFSEVMRARMSARARLLFLARFHQSSKTVTKVVQFCAQSLESSYGVRCRLIPLHKLQFVAMHECFTEYKARIIQLVIGALNDLRNGEDELQGPITLASEFVREVLRERDVQLLRNTKSKNTLSHRIGIGDEESLYIKSVAATAAPFYRMAASQQLRSLGSVVAYGKWVGKQIKREREILDVLGLRADWPVIARGLHAAMVGGSGFVAALEDPKSGLSAEIASGTDVSDLFAVLTTLSFGDEGGGINIANRAYRRLLRREYGSRMKVVLEAAKVLPRDKVADDALREAFAELLRCMHYHASEVIPKCFLSHRSFYVIWNELVTLVLKMYPGTPRSYSDHIDAYLHNNKSDDEAAEGDMLDFFKNTFACITQKDEFFANYKASLARRLLRGQFRRTLESQFLARLKVISGNAEVYPLTAMISDMDNSEKLSADMLGSASMEDFLAKEKVKAKVILTTAQYWPTFEMIDMMPHPCIDTFAKYFESFYQSRFPNRRVRWLYMASTAVVNTRFAQGPKELSGSLIQATILLLVDGTIGKKLPELAFEMKLRKETIADAIASMYMNKKVNVLECVDPATGQPLETKRITDSLTFRINLGFKSPSRKLDLPKSRAAKGIDMTQLENLRKELGKIAIVRFMKSRGTATYAEMVDAALADLRRKFDAQPPLVKAQLEELIDREIVRRDTNDPMRLVYVA